MTRTTVKLLLASMLILGAVSHATAGTGGPAGGKRLIIAQGAEPETLDPHATSITLAHNVSFQIVERLVTQTDMGDLEPVLALRWEPVGERTWRFHLRPNVKFTNGEPMNAEAVRFSLERLLRPDPTWGSTVGHYLSAVESVKAVDDLTVDVVTKKPFGLMPYNLIKVGIVPPKHVAAVGNVAFGRNPVGTGQFVLGEWRRGVHVLLRANPQYWGPKPKIEEVEFRGIPDPLTRVSALLAKDADLITQFPVQEAERVKRLEGLRVVDIPSLRSMHLLINTLAPGPLQDRRVRQALNLAIDKNALVQKILGGYGRVLKGQMLTELYFGFHASLEAYPYDAERARRLLREAGYPNGFSIELATPRGRYMNDLEIAQTIAAYLEAVGIRVNLQVYELAAYLGMLAPKKLPGLSLWGWAVSPADADSQLGLNLSTHPYSYFRNAEFDDLMLKARETTNQAARRSLYHRAAAILREEASNVFLYQQYDLYGVSDRVKGWQPRADEFLVFTGVSKE